MFHFGFGFDDEARFDEDRLIPRIREILKIPDLEIAVYKISHWTIERALAEKYRGGRMFIAGDAAHRRPPTTGLGLNTAIEDSLNLAWKLDLVLRGKGSPKVLDTYDAERRPIGMRNCDWGLFTFENSAVINAAVGLIPGNKDANKVRFEKLFEDSEMGRTLRAQVRRMIEPQRIEFSAHDIELGFRYHSGFLVPDGTPDPGSDPLGQEYVPSTRPRSRLPHAWLENGDQILSTHDLIGDANNFLLITDEEGKGWISATERFAAKHSVKVLTAQIGAPPYIRDYEDHWQRAKGVEQGGALLVRPDNFIAWRSLQQSKKDGREVVDALESLLGMSASGLHGLGEI